jgi:hypothetical protein
VFFLHKNERTVAGAETTGILTILPSFPCPAGNSGKNVYNSQFPVHFLCGFLSLVHKLVNLSDCF